MLNFGSKPSQDASLRKIAIWGADLVLCNAPKFGPHPGGSYGGRGGLSFYVGRKGRQWTQISHRKLKKSISHSMVIWVQEPDAMLKMLVSRFEILVYLFQEFQVVWGPFFQIATSEADIYLVLHHSLCLATSASQASFTLLIACQFWSRLNFGEKSTCC